MQYTYCLFSVSIPDTGNETFYPNSFHKIPACFCPSRFGMSYASSGAEITPTTALSAATAGLAR